MNFDNFRYSNSFITTTATIQQTLTTTSPNHYDNDKAYNHHAAYDNNDHSVNDNTHNDNNHSAHDHNNHAANDDYSTHDHDHNPYDLYSFNDRLYVSDPFLIK
ncbi:MAG: hypothetical protein Q9216_003726 [Gyalolechia sp. 2 TL-2023]